jgi:arsenate reductase
MARVLFVCLHNAGRSQMSEALFTRAAAGHHEVRSAGTMPGDRVHPEVVEAMGWGGGGVWWAATAPPPPPAS